MFKRKINIKFLLDSFKTLTNSEDCSENRISLCPSFPSLSLVDFLQCTFMAGFRNNFHDRRRLSEQLSESQDHRRRLENRSKLPKRVTRRIFTISKQFYKSKLKLYHEFSSRKNCEKTISTISKETVFILVLSKKYLSCDTIPLRGSMKTTRPCSLLDSL